MSDSDELTRVEEAFWGEIPDDDRDQVATQIAEQIVDKPHGLLDVGYLIPLARAFLEKVEANEPH